MDGKVQCPNGVEYNTIGKNDKYIFFKVFCLWSNGIATLLITVSSFNNYGYMSCG